MKPEQAVKLVREMERYSYIMRHAGRGETRRLNKHGHLVRQVIIPLATASQERVAIGVGELARYARISKAEWVNVDKLISEQSCLTIRSLVYQLRRFAELQKRHRPLTIPLSGGWHFIWDGNHRCTAGLLLGKKRIRCDVLRKKP